MQKIIFKPMNCLKFTAPGFLGLEIGDGCKMDDRKTGVNPMMQM